MRITARSVLGTALTATTVAALSLGSVASAEPEPPFTPVVPADIVAVGSDTIQDVDNALAAAWNNDGKTPRFANYNSLGTTPFSPKTGCPSITRPDGSSAGITALLNTATVSSGGQTFNCIDIARSSRDKNPAVPAENNLAFVFLGFDAVGVVTQPTTNAPSNFTTAELQSIYTCAVTTWHQLDPALPSNNTIQPFLPQAGSGTRAFVLSSIGVSEATLGTCVNDDVQENTGTDLPNNANVVAPYSIAQYLSQSTHPDRDRHGTTVLKNVDGQAATADGAINPDFPYQRNVYNVVKSATPGSDPTVPSRYLPLLAPASDGGYLCGHLDIVADFGFLTNSALCGTVF